MQGKAMVWLEWVGVLGAVLLIVDLGWTLLRGEASAFYFLDTVLTLAVFALLWRGARASRADDLEGLTRSLRLAAGASVASFALLALPFGSVPGWLHWLLGFLVALTPALGLLALAAVLRRVHELMQDEELTV